MPISDHPHVLLLTYSNIKPFSFKRGYSFNISFFLYFLSPKQCSACVRQWCRQITIMSYHGQRQMLKYLGSCLPSMKCVQVMHGSQRRTHWMCHQSKHMEVVTQLTGSHQQGTSGVKGHMGHWFISVGVEVGYQTIAIIVFIHIKLNWKSDTASTFV